MPPSSLTKEQSEKLCELWEAGLTSVGNKKKLSEAAEATGLPEKTIKVNCKPFKICLLCFTQPSPAFPS